MVEGRPWTLAGCFVVGLGFGCPSPDVFNCANDDQCGVKGTCQPNGYCSFNAVGCESGQAFGEASPPELVGQCVPAASGSGQGTGTVGPVDGSTGGSSGAATATIQGTADGSESGTGPIATATSASSSSEDTGPSSARITEGLVVLYDFTNPEGLTIPDSSGRAPEIPLTVIQDGGSPLVTADGLVFNYAGVALAEGSSEKVRVAIQASGALTVEVWNTPSVVNQFGPPRLFSLSASGAVRSFSMVSGTPTMDSKKGDGDEMGFRIFTGGSTNTNGLPAVLADEVVTLTTMHWVATRTTEGVVALYSDGELLVTESLPGVLGVWPPDHQLAVGNEPTQDRPYLGTIHLAAVYDRALSAAEVNQNLSAGF